MGYGGLSEYFLAFHWGHYVVDFDIESDYKAGTDFG